MENTAENNKLIAEFIGQTEITINVPFTYQLNEEMPTSGNICKSEIDAIEEVQTEFDEGNLNGCDIYTEAPNYHTSWDWLMPVVEKILDISFQDEGDAEDFYSIRDCIPDINHTYKAVVEFIMVLKTRI